MIISKKLKNFKNIKHGFFNRNGGSSPGIYKSLNCGMGSYDEKKNHDQSSNENEKKDQLYMSAIQLVKSEGKASTSFLQRKLQIGYNRAARIVDMMEDDGIVSKPNHVGKREIL